MASPANRQLTDPSLDPSTLGSGQGHILQRLDRSIVLVGLMGAGKSTIGRRLAARLRMPFIDADDEIEKAAGLPVAEIFSCYGEAAFRDGERRVIARLMRGRPAVLATGGGAFMTAPTRDLILAEAISIWLDADVDVLVERTSRRNTRPLLLKGDPRTILETLSQERNPVYAQADIRIASGRQQHDIVVRDAVAALTAYQSSKADFVGTKVGSSGPNPSAGDGDG